MKLPWLTSTLVVVLIVLSDCQGETSTLAGNEIKPIQDKPFTLVALRSGALFAYNPTLHDEVLTTRYSDSVGDLIRPILGKLPPSCVFAGFSASTTGALVRGSKRGSLRLNVDALSDVRPLQQLEQQQLREASRTIRSETIC
jgi:hypothetical protein